MSTYIQSIKMFNFAKVRELKVDFARGLSYLVGINGSGKTTVIYALWAGLKGIVSKGKPGALIANRYEMIGDYAKTSKLEIDLYDTVKEMVVQVRTKITKAGNEITATDQNGAPMPEGYVDNLFNLMCIDPTSFAGATPQEQALALGIDTSEYDEKVKALKADRTDITREVKRLQGVVANWGELKEVEPVDTVKLVAEKDKIIMFNQEQELLGDQLEAYALTKFMDDKAGELREKGSGWGEIPFNDRRDFIIQHLNSLVEPVEHKPTVEIDEKIANADQTNRDANDYQTYTNDKAALKTQVDLGVKQNKAIDKVLADRTAYIKSCKLPFSNMSIDENGCLAVGDRTFAEVYRSSGELWSMSAKLLATLNPELKVIIVRDANILDDDKRAGIEALSKPVMSKDGKEVIREAYQVIFEYVDTKPVEDRHTILLKECELVNSYDESANTGEEL